MSRPDDDLAAAMRDSAMLLCGTPEQYLASIRAAAADGDLRAAAWLAGRGSVEIDPETRSGSRIDPTRARG